MQPVFKTFGDQTDAIFFFKVCNRPNLWLIKTGDYYCVEESECPIIRNFEEVIMKRIDGKTRLIR